MEKEINPDSKNRAAAIKMGLGISLGIIIGLASKNIAMGLIIGIVIGGISVIITRFIKSKTN